MHYSHYTNYQIHHDHLQQKKQFFIKNIYHLYKHKKCVIELKCQVCLIPWSFFHDSNQTNQLITIYQILNLRLNVFSKSLKWGAA